MTEDDNIAIIKHIYDELVTKESTQAFVDAFAENGVLRLTIPADTGLAGPFHGKQALVHYLALSNELTEIVELEVRDFIGRGDKVVLLGYERLRVRATGKTFASEWAAVFDMNDGKIARLTLIEDCSELTIACRGLG